MTTSNDNHSDRLSSSDSKNHPDFQLRWVQAIINGDNVEIVKENPKDSEIERGNTMFNQTLNHESGIKARIHLKRPCPEPDSLTGIEDVFIISIGNGLDGKGGRAHGGFNSLVLDHITGTAAAREAKAFAPATAFLNVDYKAPILTPLVFLARAWAVKISGRKFFVNGVIEDGSGKVLATGKSLFVAARTEAKSSL